MPTMRRSCISTVSCLGLAWGGAGAPRPHSSSPLPAATAQPHPPAMEAPFLRTTCLFPCVPSQGPNTPHVRGPPELWGPPAGCSPVCQGAGCKKCHHGEEPWSRQARHLGSLVPAGRGGGGCAVGMVPCLCLSPAHSRSPTSTLPHSDSGSLPSPLSPLCPGSPISTSGCNFTPRAPR